MDLAKEGGGGAGSEGGAYLLYYIPPPAPSHAYTFLRRGLRWRGRGKFILYISFQRGISSPFGTPVRACLTPILFFFFGLLKGWTRLPLWGPQRAGGTLPSGRPSRQARRCHRRAMTERASSKFRRAKPRGIFLSYPATGRKNRGFAGVKFLQTKIPAGEAQRDFLVSPGLTSQVSLRSTCSKAERAELALCPFRLKKEIYEKETCTRVNWKNRSSRRGPG